jgi:hypothetical protein
MKIRLVHPAIGEFSFPVTPGRPVIVGRAGPDVDVELNWDVRVSRRHARLWVDGSGDVFLEDLGSRNGTWCGNTQLHGIVRLDPMVGALIGETVLTVPEAHGLELFLEEDTYSGLEPFPAPDRDGAYLSTMDLRLQSGDLATPSPRPPRIDTPLVQVTRPVTPGAALSALTAPAGIGAVTPPPYSGPLVIVSSPEPSTPPVQVTTHVGPTPYSAPPPGTPVSTPGFSPLPAAPRGVLAEPLTEDALLATPSSSPAPSKATNSPAPRPISDPAPGARAATPRLPQGRFLGPDHVEVSLSGPVELMSLWREHLSRGGLFVATGEMRALYHRLDVTLSTPGGSLTLGATVVHASDPARARELGVPPGLGLQLSELSAANKAAIQAYAEGMSPTLTVRTAPPRAVSTVDVDAAFAQAKRLLDRLEKNDVYGALEVLPEATDSIVQEKIAGIAATLGAAAKGAPAHKSARLEAALLALGRLSHALGDTLRRLEHDLMRGHIRADARLAAAKSGTGPSISELRRIWQQVAPDKVDRAAFLTRKAFTAKQRGDLDEAIRAANDALVENPFFDELRPTLSSWERQKTERKDFGPGFASPVRVRR